MCALGQYLEREGLPTVVLSLIREHSDAIKPPRALWVPFELGRPLGPPGDGDFQRRVLQRLLTMFEETAGPVSAAFEEEIPSVPNAADNQATWVCPVSFPKPISDPSSSSSIGAAVKHEVQSLEPWFELSRERRGRTTVGLSNRPIQEIVDLLAGYVGSGDLGLNGDCGQLPAHQRIKYAMDDLLAFYQESATAQPGPQAGSRDILKWFWTDTEAGQLFAKVKDRALAGDDESLQFIVSRLLIPRAMDNVIDATP